MLLILFENKALFKICINGGRFDDVRIVRCYAKITVRRGAERMVGGAMKGGGVETAHLTNGKIHTQSFSMRNTADMTAM